MSYETIRKEVLDAILEAVNLGLIKGTSGNIAVREEGGDKIAITPSGIPYKTMTTEDIAIITLDGEWIDGRFKPSSELPMHTAVLRVRNDVNATVHTHSIFATIMAMDEENLQPTTPPQAEFSPIRTVPFIMPGTRELAEAVVNTLANDRVVLLRNHGMLCCGKSIRHAMAAAIYTEEMAQTAYYAKLLGNFKPLPEDAILKMQALIASDQAV
jgi:L-fuculose-phosphate aldolase